MKKIILFLLLVLVSVTASARKSYIDVYAERFSSGVMTGDIPMGVADFRYDTTDAGYTYAYFSCPVGSLLTILGEYGYEVVSMCTYDKYAYATHYLLAREVPSNQTQMKGDVNEDNSVNISDVNEVISLILGKLREHPEILEQIKNKP